MNPTCDAFDNEGDPPCPNTPVQFFRYLPEGGAVALCEKHCFPDSTFELSLDEYLAIVALTSA